VWQAGVTQSYASQHIQLLICLEIIVITAINIRAHRNSGQQHWPAVLGTPTGTHRSRLLHSVQLLHFIPCFQHPHECSPDQTTSVLPSLAYWFTLVPQLHFSLCHFRTHCTTSCALQNLSSGHITTVSLTDILPGPELSLSLQNPQTST